MSEGWRERLRAEHNELKERLRRLELFMMADEMPELSPKEQALLIAQTYAMNQYLDILGIRLSFYR